MLKDIKKPEWNKECIVNVNYRDYLHLRDDKTVLRNPHKGWYWHFVDNGCGRIIYRDVDQNDDLLDFPGLNHLYIRLDWSDIEKEEGVYDWSYVDEVMKVWGERGYRFSFRVCTYEGRGIEYAAPKWLRDKGVNGWWCDCDAWQPDYGDPLFLEKLDLFMQEYSRKFNGHPLVEFVDVGTYGTWGEGHNGYGKNQYFPIEVIKKHINLHIKYFTKTPVIVNDDLLNAAPNEDGKKRKELVEYCLSIGLGLRDDTIICRGYSADRYDSLITPFLFERFYENAPIDIECEHYSNVPPEVNRGGFPIYETLRKSHASYCGFHGYPREWLKDNYYVAERLGNKMGYWYFIDGAIVPVCVSGISANLKLFIRNEGFCHAYNPFDFKIKFVSNKSGEEYTVFSENGRNRQWKAESSYEENFKLNLENVPSGEYTVCVGMFENEKPIKLGFRPECLREDGFYEIDVFNVIDFE